MSSSVIILAAGIGSRMKSDMPKVLHPLGGVPVLAHVLASIAELEAERLVVVTGHGAERVEKAVAELAPAATCVRQGEPLGTGHAVAQALPALEGAEGDVFILYGDTPFITPETLERMRAARQAGAALVFLGFEAADPGTYGRMIVRDGALEAIVEAREATPEQAAISLCNSGLVCAEAATLHRLVPRIGNDNAKGEFYLTDLVAMARAEGLACAMVECPEAETLGINSRADLAAAEAAFQSRRRAELLEAGVGMTAPETVFLALDTAIGPDTTIGPNVVFGPGVTVENGVTILPFCHLEGCHISEGARIGPFARLRPGAEIGEDARIGNYVEVKEAQIGRGAKVNHLSYVGDASVGEAANLGAGTITCNYDGVMKHCTEIGERAFIGSNSALVAPVRVGDEALVGSGSVITEDVPDGALALARDRQVNKPGLARRLMNRLRAQKRARDRGKG
ncbi:MAG: bifunctional UDP-N-acetylglucosamine diphosphorylase/glucosamine-1-phosphate N-acetyltransferase GlmU [Alphaproteobacteria bacterium]|nr:MAG: bifunctional UDP-N-acetylglucosamine diphosphorylase/glucosamine-1-phosphate N-acetyltransferase GlmU [Alphaproteobacteria bacterium]